MKVIIAGGGIGGLTTALMLHERNIDVYVYETAATIREAGVGINICLLYTSPSPRDKRQSRMPSSA